MNILINDFVLVFLMLLRISSLFLSAPIFGHRAIPAIIKIFLALVIAYTVFLTMQGNSIPFELSMSNLFVLAINEVLIGLILGFSLNIVFWAVAFAGSLIGITMGLSMAEVFNPATGTSNNVIGEILFLISTMVFFIINGHHYVITSLYYSFQILPVGFINLSGALFEMIIKFGSTVILLAVKIASPFIVIYFLLYVAEGIIARVIPQMQVFFVTQPIHIGFGFFLLIATTPVFVLVVKNLLRDFQAQLLNIIKAMSA